MLVVMTWTACLGSLFVPWYMIRRYGLMAGGRAAWAVVLLLMPCWMRLWLTMHIDGRAICAVVLLIAWLRTPWGDDQAPGFHLADLLIMMLVASMAITQIVLRTVEPLPPFDQFREIALPYLVGRMFIRSPRDIDSILPIFCKCLVFLSCFAMVEAFTHKNPLELVIRKEWSNLDTVGGIEEQEAVRWGLKRAYGPQTHPIYLGLTFAMMLPWAVEAAVQAFNRRGPGWWKLVPFFTLGGVVASTSRAAQVCSLIVLASILFHSVPRIRPILLLAVAFGGIGFMVFRDEVVESMQNYAGESKEDDSYVKINREKYEYSGTKHRDLLFVVYEDAIEKNGWLGYGMLMRRMPRDPDMDKRFHSIDNHYLMFYLQYGYVGITIFALLAVTVSLCLIPGYFGSTGPPGRLIAGILGANIGCLLSMRSVWFAPDYSAVWLFTVGVAVSLACWYRQARRARANQST